MRLVKLFALALMVVALISCASTPQRTKHYNFNPSSIAKPGNNNQTKQITVNQLQLATFLDQPGLVIQLNKNQVYTSTYHRWAQPLREILLNTLVQELNNTSPVGYSFNKEKPLSVKGENTQLFIEVEQFNSTDQSQAIFSGRYWVNKGDKTLLVNQSFRITEKLSEDGYPHSVKMLQLTLTQLAKEINIALQNKE
jgi:uncharacterized lipoprotein YmbA